MLFRSLSPLQWDMAQIDTPQAHAITGGGRSVLVGDIDSGMDFEHPDLAPNYDAANSADCSSGAAAPLPPGNDHLGHGTHTAGTIAAASNGVGIVGVAPNVRIAAIKAISPDFFLFPEMIVCAFMWAGNHHMDVTNNSYFADPWLYNCRNDPEQRAIWNAERRAIKFAMSHASSLSPRRAISQMTWRTRRKTSSVPTRGRGRCGGSETTAPRFPQRYPVSSVYPPRAP